MSTGAHKAVIQIAATVDGDSDALNINILGANEVNASITAPTAMVGSLTTRTDDTHGIITITNPAAHGLDGSEILGVFWTAAGVKYACYGCTITAHDTTTVTITAAGGDHLPTAATAVMVAVAQSVPIAFTGSGLLFLRLSAKAGAAGLANVYSSTPTLLLSSQIYQASPYIWPQAVGASAPFSAAAATVVFYNGTQGATVMSLLALL